MAERRPFRKLSVEALESRLVLSSAQGAPESLADAVSAQVSSFAPELARVDLSAIGDGSCARLAVELVVCQVVFVELVIVLVVEDEIVCHRDALLYCGLVSYEVTCAADGAGPDFEGLEDLGVHLFQELGIH